MAAIGAGVVKIVSGEIVQAWYTDVSDIPSTDLNFASTNPESCVVVRGDDIMTWQGNEWLAPTGN